MKIGILNWKNIFFSSLLDDFPPKLPSEEKPASSRVEDVVDGELFFDLSTPTSSSPGFRPVKSARLEVGGKGLPGGGIWNVSDKPRSGKAMEFALIVSAVTNFALSMLNMMQSLRQFIGRGGGGNAKKILAGFSRTTLFNF